MSLGHPPKEHFSYSNQVRVFETIVLLIISFQDWQHCCRIHGSGSVRFRAKSPSSPAPGRRLPVPETATDKEIETFLATREDNYKKATKVIKAQIVEFAKPLYEKRRADYHAVKPIKERRADLQKIVSNCDEALLNIEKSEKLAAAAAPPVVAAPVAAPVAASSPAPVAKKKVKKKSA